MDAIRTLTSFVLFLFACACILAWASWYNDRAFGIFMDYNPIYVQMFPGAGDEARSWTAVGFGFGSFLLAWAVYPSRRDDDD